MIIHKLQRYFYRGGDPERIARSALVFVGVASMLLLTFTFYLGEKLAYSHMGIDPDRYEAMEEEIPALREQLAALQAKLEMAQTQANIDSKALDMLRGDLAGQKEEIASLEEGVRFYRSLMAPGEIAQGLSLRPLELVALDRPRQYVIRIVAQQEARKHDMLEGELRGRIDGTRDGEEASYDLADLSDDFDQQAIKLHFRYFQSIEGTLTLPEGFEPQWVDLEASSTAPKAMQVHERFPWRLREGLSSVGS